MWSKVGLELIDGEPDRPIEGPFRGQGSRTFADQHNSFAYQICSIACTSAVTMPLFSKYVSFTVELLYTLYKENSHKLITSIESYTSFERVQITIL